MEFTALYALAICAGSKTFATCDLYNGLHVQKPFCLSGHCYRFSSCSRRFREGLCGLRFEDTECDAGNV